MQQKRTLPDSRIACLVPRDFGLYAFITLFGQDKHFSSDTRYKLQLRRVRKLKKDFHGSQAHCCLPSSLLVLVIPFIYLFIPTRLMQIYFTLLSFFTDTAGWNPNPFFVRASFSANCFVWVCVCVVLSPAKQARILPLKVGIMLWFIYIVFLYCQGLAIGFISFFFGFNCKLWTDFNY